MATKTIISDQSGPKLPGATTPLFIKVETVYNLDSNGNPDPTKPVVNKLLYTPNGSTFFVAAESSEGGKSGSWVLKKYTPAEIFNAGIAQYVQPDGSILGPSAAVSLNTSGGVMYQAAQNSIKQSATKAGISPEHQKPLSTTLKNTSNPSPQEQQGGLNQEAVNLISDDIKKISSRNSYDDNTPIIYPEKLKSEYQDCIKFSVVKYNPSGLKGFGPGNRDLRRINVDNGSLTIKNRKIIGTIVLPIPGGISDSNRVNWSDSNLSDLGGALGRLITTGVTGGDLGSELERQAKEAAKPGSGTRTAIVAKAAESAIGAEGLMQRQFGVIVNPNLELLFNSPDLRQFSFSFKLSPRSASEAKIVKKIIRTFKQAMSVKRSESSFLLQSPHTFAISYIFQNKRHPYLNKFKECALTNCNINYTPEGNYMSFNDSNDPSMVSYQLDLQFQELEPIYDDDYGNDYDNIGY